jgi:hypothetical protein
VLAIRGGAFAGLCDRAHALGLTCAPSVGPGYNATRATGDERVRTRRQGGTYDAMWRAAIAAVPDRVTITSYNEWHEGTQIEPARRHPLDWYGTYESYEGAYGRQGKAAESAYIVRRPTDEHVSVAGRRVAVPERPEQPLELDSKRRLEPPMTCWAARCVVLSRPNSAAIEAPCVLASHPPSPPRRRSVILNRVLRPARRPRSSRSTRRGGRPAPLRGA